MEARTQITVRLSSANVRHIDEAVQAGQAPSRAAYLDKLADRARRKAAAARDAVIYQAIAGSDDPDPDDWAGLAEWGARQPLDQAGDAAKT